MLQRYGLTSCLIALPPVLIGCYVRMLWSIKIYVITFLRFSPVTITPIKSKMWNIQYSGNVIVIWCHLAFSKMVPHRPYSFKSYMHKCTPNFNLLMAVERLRRWHETFHHTVLGAAIHTPAKRRRFTRDAFPPENAYPYDRATTVGHCIP